jgi:hypothetical protein
VVKVVDVKGGECVSGSSGGGGGSSGGGGGGGGGGGRGGGTDVSGGVNVNAVANVDDGDVAAEEANAVGVGSGPTGMASDSVAAWHALQVLP